MEQNEVSNRLRALAADDKRRPETARLRDVFDDVEATLAAGVSQADVLAELHQCGYTMTMASFKSALQRIRKELQKGNKTGPVFPARAVTPLSFAQKVKAPGDAKALPQAHETGATDGDDLDGLTEKQRRERVADRYIRDAENPLLKRILKDKKP